MQVTEVVSALLCSEVVLGVKITFGGIIYMENKEGKKAIKEGQMTQRWRQYERENRKRWLTLVNLGKECSYALGVVVRVLLWILLQCQSSSKTCSSET